MSYGTLQIEKMTTESGYSLGAGNASSFKNRLINGGMVIDQRNAGASVSTSTINSTIYTLDRYYYVASQASKFTIQQNAGSVTPPAGFKYYAGLTSTSAYSVVSSDLFIFEQKIEGYNMADWAWGTASAKSITFSFWVYSSLTGTFSGSLRNVDDTRNYAYTYTINAANTWEYKTVTVAGDTSGTWNSTSGAGLKIGFNIGAGSTYTTTAGSWGGTVIVGATGSVNLVGTNGATFYVTGLQVEVGTVATSFDFRPYGTELALCQRYFQRLVAGGDFAAFSTGTVVNSNETFLFNQFIVPMRSAPSVTPSTLSNFQIISGGTTTTVTSFISRVGGVVANSYVSINLDAVHAAVLTPGYAGTLINQASTTPTLSFSSEL